MELAPQSLWGGGASWKRQCGSCPRPASWLQARSRSRGSDGGTEGLGGQERAPTRSGLAEPPAPICRGAARPPQVGWETSEPRSACSPNILLTADGSHSSPSPCGSGCTSLPFAYPSCQLFVSAFGGGEAAGKPPKATCGWQNLVLRLWDVCKGEETWIPTCLVREARARPVPTRVCLSLLGQMGLQHDLRGARELVPGPGLTFLEQLLGTRWCADCQGHRRRVQPCPPGAPSPVGNQGTWGRNDGAWMRSASGSAGSWRLCERGRCLG